MNYNEHDLKMTLSCRSLVLSFLLSYDSQRSLRTNKTKIRAVLRNVFRGGAHEIQKGLQYDVQQGQGWKSATGKIQVMRLAQGSKVPSAEILLYGCEKIFFFSPLTLLFYVRWTLPPKHYKTFQVTLLSVFISM